MVSVERSVVEAVQLALSSLPKSRNLVVGISGPQGSGKTTVCKMAAHALSEQGVPTEALSLDDFYLPHKELQAIAARGNPLLQHRGLPGTHDVALLQRTISDFLTLPESKQSSFNSTTASLKVPVYDKSLHNGAGDRLESQGLPASTRVILLEGWMLGFQPLGSEAVSKRVQEVANATIQPSADDLVEVDTKLSDYVKVWEEVPLWIRLIPESLDYVYTWRLNQEHDLIKARGNGMTDNQVRKFVDQYMPCYILYVPSLNHLPASTRKFVIKQDHSVESSTKAI